MRRLLSARCASGPRRAIATPVPWAERSELPGPADPLWGRFGSSVLHTAQQLDSGSQAFDEALAARAQLQQIVNGAGLDLKVCIFGGVVSNGLLESGGDVDFVAVSDVEPAFGEASRVVAQLGREMRRVGLRATAVPRARVPVVKVDRVSNALPGAPLHSVALKAAFQLTRPADPAAQAAFDDLVTRTYGAVSVEWNPSRQIATVSFPDTTAVLAAITEVRSIAGVDIPLRLPLEPRHGPELYRYPFDLCLQSSGLLNSHLLRRALAQHPFARHLVLFLKRWGRSSGVVSTVDGLLASYAVVVMAVHYMVRLGLLPPLDVHQFQEPQFLPTHPQYRPLEGSKDGDVAALGYHTAHFFQYFGHEFDYGSEVVCTTTAAPVTKRNLKWERRGEASQRKPPYHGFCIKDPYGVENIARNLSPASVAYVRDAHRLALRQCLSDAGDPEFAVSNLAGTPPRPDVEAPAEGEDPQSDARQLLRRVEFHSRKDSMQRVGEATTRRNREVRAAQDLTRSIIHWIRGAGRKAK